MSVISVSVCDFAPCFPTGFVTALPPPVCASKACVLYWQWSSLLHAVLYMLWRPPWCYDMLPVLSMTVHTALRVAPPSSHPLIQAPVAVCGCVHYRSIQPQTSIKLPTGARAVLKLRQPRPASNRLLGHHAPIPVLSSESHASGMFEENIKAERKPCAAGQPGPSANAAQAR